MPQPTWWDVALGSPFSVKCCRALLAELKLSRMLLGSSSAEQFLLVLAEEDIPRANEFLAREASAIDAAFRRYAAVGVGEYRKTWALGRWYASVSTML